MSLNTLTIINAFEALIACILSAVAAANAYTPVVRWALAATAALAGAYAISMGWAVITDDLGAWLHPWRTLGVIAWPVAWWFPALAGLRSSTRLRREAARTLDGEAQS